MTYNNYIVATAIADESSHSAEPTSNSAAPAAENHASTQVAANTETGHEESGILGVNGGAFIIQLITFILVYVLLKKFAFDKIVRLLDERHKTIDDGVRMGMRMEKEKAKLDEEIADKIREARHEADAIVAAANKDARAAIRDAEKLGQKKADAIIADAEVRAEEESKQAKLRLEKDIVGLVGKVTEVIVGEKVDAQKDSEIINKAMKGRG